jgi:hypothetical protein
LSLWTKRIDFALWPVGQGLFTHADIWVGGNSFRVVYDCGTFCSHKVIGSSFFDPLAGRDVDLLVISHFHWDHISRIPQLMDAAGKVKEVWIPYLSPEQRFLFAASTAMGGIDAGESPSSIDDVTRIAAAAREWFEARGCIVHEIGGPGDDEALGRGPQDGEGGPVPEHGERDSDPPEELRVTAPRRLPGAFVAGSAFRAYQSHLEAIPRSASGPIESPVRLLTWIRPIDPTQMIQLQSKLQARLFLELVDTQNLSAVVQTLRERVSRTDVQDLYKSLNSDLNSGSLFLLAQPTCSSRPAAGVFSNIRSRSQWRVEATGQRNSPAPSFLWTGDATSEVLEQLLSDSFAPLRDPIGCAFVHQVPHHGSGGCLSQEWIDIITGDGSFPASSVISAGRNNRFHHPSPEAVLKYRSAVICEGGSAFEASLAWR